ncbi:MAG: proline--tRNA ligase [Candidatus Omnitrophica bacterium]|nr:proline--tRNA ligase [Candidatus Omnitrophota bacterium]
MRWSNTLIPTLREDPQDAEAISHKLMMRAGLIRKLTAGAYSYLPLGFRALKKAEDIIREEMDRSGALELLLPALHPVELWKKTGRYDVLGDVLIKYRDRHGREIALGPTHEEVITDLVSKEISTYKSLPRTLYQIQTKFRDEIRPRFGVIRSSEFIMKDAYSFDEDEAGLEESYKKMYDAYCRIFERCELPYVAVQADPGIMGGNISHEFMVPSEIGEDEIVLCKCGYAASTEVAACGKTDKAEVKEKAKSSFKEVGTPGVSSVEKVSELLKAKTTSIIKTLIYIADGKPLAFLVRGDYEVNNAKLKGFLKANILEMADAETIEKLTGAPVGFSGPIGLKMRILADFSVRGMKDAVTGANKKDKHFINVDTERDIKPEGWLDARMITPHDPCPACGGKIEIKHAIEIGHTFKLGVKYSESLGARFLDKDGKLRPVIMGCYGIGVNRILAATVEVSNDKDGIIWPESISPYRIAILPLNLGDDNVKNFSEELYKECLKKNMDVIIDDRPERAGVKFKDADLIGFPFQVIIGEKNLKSGKIELKTRIGKKTELIEKNVIMKKLEETRSRHT